MKFNKIAQDHEKTLDVFANGRIGELISEVIGNDTLQSLFEQTPTFQADDYAGKPSGIIALDIGIVKPEMKDALLVAQAAARAIAIVEGKIEPKALNDDIFKFVGSDRDSQALKHAQATWMGANVVERTPENLAAFKQSASEQLRSAAKVISASGFPDQALKLEGLADYTKPETKTALTPNTIFCALAKNTDDPIIDKLAKLTKNIEIIFGTTPTPSAEN